MAAVPSGGHAAAGSRLVMLSIELITGDFEADGSAAFTTTAGVHVLINPADVVRISQGDGNTRRSRPRSAASVFEAAELVLSRPADSVVHLDGVLDVRHPGCRPSRGDGRVVVRPRVDHAEQPDHPMGAVD